MEINSKKPGIARSSDENQALAKAQKTKESQFSQSATSAKQPELKEGQQVKGQILDLRYNEVRIRLEPEKQIITAKLTGDVPLAIGEEARFVVTEENGQRLSLKYLPDNTAASSATITKALTASCLPLTDRNKAIVEQLLKHRMPIDKQTLSLLSKAAIMNKEASPLTLVLMYKNNISLTSSNIRQYESYQNGTGQLLKDIQSITSNITDLLRSTDAVTSSDHQLKEALQINDKLLSMLTEPAKDASTLASVASSYRIADETSLEQTAEGIAQATEAMEQTAEGMTQSTDAMEQTAESMTRSTDAMKQIAKALKQAMEASSLSDNIASEQQAYSSGNSSLENALRSIRQLSPELAELINNPASYNHDDLLSLIKALPSELQKLAGQYLQPNNADHPLNVVLGKNGQEWLAAVINGQPDSASLSSKLTSGTATLQEVFSYLQDRLPKMDASLAKAILSSPEYSELIEYAFQKKWSITPEQLTQKGSISELYHKLEEDMEKLRTIENADGKTQELLRTQEPVKNLQENLQFMKDLNEMFSYIQLPVQLKNKAIHSELYVFTNKRHLQEKKNLSVLLHLAMPNLGPLNIHVQMDHNLINAKFYLEDNTAKDIIEDQLPSLTQALKEKGYYLTSDVLHTYHKTDFTKDFIEQTSEEGTPVRYTFDIRT